MIKAYLFPGQGSQKTGMASRHYRFNKFFKKRCDQANEILGYRITDIMFEGPVETLNQTKYTQPALFLHSVSLFENLGHQPDMLAGHSLGEYSALTAAGVLKFEDALQAVQKRGELMQKAGEEQPGAMVAIIGLDETTVETACRDISEKYDRVIVPANYNGEGQIVVSGQDDAMEDAMNIFKEAGARIVKKLPVSGAFHTSLMESVQKPLDEILDRLTYHKPKAFVYSNATGTESDSPDVLKENLKKQLLCPVLWTHTLRNMYENGARHFVEVGPGNVLQGMVKRTLKNIGISGFQ